MFPVLGFRVLGPLVVTDDDTAVELTSARQRRVVAALLLRVGRPVPMSALAEAVWGQRPPRSASNTIQSYVSRLRSLLGGDRLPWTGGGYLLAVEPVAVDAYRFEARIEAARTAPTPEDAVAALDQALALWGGEPYQDLADYDPAVA